MIERTLDGIESIRVMRAEGNLSVVGVENPPVTISSELEPDLRQSGAMAELYLAADAELRVPPGVALEVTECDGRLEIEDFTGNLAIGRVAGHLGARNVGVVALRGNIDGRCHVENGGAIAGRCVKGDLVVEGARSVSFDLVAGDVICTEIAGEAAIEQIGGRCRLDRIGGDFRSHAIGGKLEVERAQALKVDSVGGKLRASQVAAELSVGTVGGKLSVDGANAVTADTVGGQVSLRAVSGNVAIRQVGGAARLLGDFAAGSNWYLRSSGRILVELGAASSVAIEAVARHGRVRVYGLEGDLRFAGRDRLSGTLGAGECKLALETTGADIIIEGEEARGRAGAGARYGWRDLGAPFESLAENLGEEIPEFVEGIVGAAGKLVAETGTLSGGLVRGVARGVGEALKEVERGLGELKREVPEQAADKLSKLGRQIRELVNEALEERRCRSGAEKERIRERVREQARRMREAMREARRARESAPARDAGHQAAPEHSGPKSERSPLDEEMLKVLAAVRAGEIDPEQADDLIRAMLEVERAEGGGKAAADRGA